MFKFISGNILESEAECLINTVNCEGYMGKGIAYQFKLKFPENNSDYIKACKNGSLRIGTLHYFNESGKFIVNFPTKNRWRAKSEIEYISKGLIELAKLIHLQNVTSIAIPPLGCGNGGLSWSEVKPLILEHLGSVSKTVLIYVYQPNKYFESKPNVAPRLTTSHLILMSIKPQLSKFNKLRLQKAAYFMNFFSGEPYFKFEKHKYGPYAHSIDVLTKDIKEFQDYYNVKTEKAFEIAKTILISNSVEKKLEHFSPSINTAVEFVNAIKTDKDLELLSSICAIIEEIPGLTEEEVLHQVRSWSEEKALKFPNSQIVKGIKFLQKVDLVELDILGNYRLRRDLSMNNVTG